MYHDNEFISMAVQKTGFHEDYVKNNYETVPDFVSALFSGIGAVSAISIQIRSQAECELCKIIREIAAEIAVLLLAVVQIAILRRPVSNSIFLFV